MSTLTSTPNAHRLSNTQQRVLDLFKDAETTGWTFGEIEDKLSDLTGSRVRTVISELVKMGLVRNSGQTLKVGRRPSTIWVIAVAS